METMELHRGRMLDHVQLVVRDLDASRRFYDAVMKVLEIPLGGEMGRKGRFPCANSSCHGPALYN